MNKGRTLGVPVYELLGGKVRNKVQVYAWIGGDRPADVETAAYVNTHHPTPLTQSKFLTHSTAKHA